MTLVALAFVYMRYDYVTHGPTHVQRVSYRHADVSAKIAAVTFFST